MPAPDRPRQAASPATWASQPSGRGLLLAAQAAWREDGVGGGQAWLRLLPDLAWPLPDSVGRFSGVWSLAPGSGGWHGAWRAEARILPLASGSVSRLDLRFVLESAPDPRALLAESARVLCADGRLLVLGLNPLGLARLRWAGHGLRALRPRTVAGFLRAEGLEILATRSLGPRWRARVDAGGASAAGGPGRVAWAVLATRRDVGLTPLRRAPAAWRGSPGVPAA